MNICINFKQTYIFYIAILLVSIISSIVRYPDFNDTLWSASDTNYQCLMNAKAMMEADEDAISWLPLITFSEDTDYGLSYSSGAFDKKTEKYFYYISFPAFPFTAYILFLKIANLAADETSIYIFINVLFCISTLLVARLFEKIFQTKSDKRIIVLLTGITFLFSVEIMHSMGMTYWGHNWYMIFFPLLWMSYIKITQSGAPAKGNYILFYLFGFMLLQTEWSAYFALFAFCIVGLIQGIKTHKKKYFFIACGIIAEMCLAIILFMSVRIYLVGFNEFINVILLRAKGRSRILDFGLFDIEKSLVDSFGGMLALIIVFFVWLVLFLICEKHKKIKVAVSVDTLTIFLILLMPLIENHVFTEHALQYSMDRMKWYFLLQFLLLYMVSKLNITKVARTVIYYSVIIVMSISFLSYLYISNDYLWHDERLADSKIIAQYIENNYPDNVYGQLSDENVWGYSKMLFGHGIKELATMNSLIERAHYLHKRYAIGLNDLELSYTQKWYSSAVIYDFSTETYDIVGTICNQYMNKMNDLVYLEYANYVDIYLEGYNNPAYTVDFPQNATLNKKIDLVYGYIQKNNKKTKNVFFSTKTKMIPNIISPLSTVENKVLFWNWESNRERLTGAKYLLSNDDTARILDMYEGEGYIYVELETDQISEFDFPNTIQVIYEEQ